jgi:hypothetical protein
MFSSNRAHLLEGKQWIYIQLYLQCVLQGTLLIHDATDEDSGEYECRVLNGLLGKALIATTVTISIGTHIRYYEYSSSN